MYRCAETRAGGDHSMFTGCRRADGLRLQAKVITGGQSSALDSDATLRTCSSPLGNYSRFVDLLQAMITPLPQGCIQKVSPGACYRSTLCGGGRRAELMG